MADRGIYIGIAGGGLTGVESAIGALKAFDDFGIKPTRMGGGSAGALVSALYVSFNYDARKLESLVKNTDINVWFKFKPWQLLKTIVHLSNHAYDTTGLYKFLQENLTLEAAKRVVVSVCELPKYKKLLLPATPAHTLASMSIPKLTPPVRWNGKLHVDGGVKDLLPTPSKHDMDNYRHVYLILCPDTDATEAPSKNWSHLQDGLDLLNAVMQREMDEIRDHWTNDCVSTLIDPPGDRRLVGGTKYESLSGGVLTWSNNFEVMESSYRYTLAQLDIARLNQKK